MRVSSAGRRLAAQPIEEQVEQSAGLVALLRRPGGEGHAAEAGQDVGGGHVAAQAAVGDASEGITANAVHPGGITATNLSRHMDPEALAGVLASGTFTDKTVEQAPRRAS